MLDDIEVLISAEELDKRNRELAEQITADFEGEQVHIIGVLKGCFMFVTDLVRYIDLDLSVDFLGLSSYGDSTKSSGVVRMTQDLSDPIEGKNVLIVEDIVDTGLTMKYLLENLQTRHPKSLSVVTLLDKPAGRKVEVPIEYTGFEIPDKFVIGYGLDYAELYRNLPYIGYVPQIEEEDQADDE
ncbi:hypoxanthine phosphoribosyltransferase [Persicimonas caeni]|uniref:Hypoxanthine phosphoribosyltransferase n=1 Tax=Persicimonas caeni TaxID=2292766 RepID=A0A4Y6Q361_PERCE|nr:hypoxanthine phosphoribosyltransferase [Persicimonas caeni]QED35828.1 hypoxanthine phosphoribosyltransferase [Persicimonas caeni]